MLTTLKLSDGSEQVLDVVELRVVLVGAPLELSFSVAPPRLHIESPGREEQWHSFVVHHRAANVMSVELQRHLPSGTPAA
jgi:predicted deacetylase